MRTIGRINDLTLAKQFSDILTVRQIEHRIELDEDVWEVWILHDDELETGRELLDQFLSDPNSLYEDDFGQQADLLRHRRRLDEKRHRSKKVDLRVQWGNGRRRKAGPVTITLIVLSVLVGLVSQMGSNLEPVQKLFFSELILKGQGFPYLYFPEIQNGEIWRVITPAFLHFGMMHIFFNLMWLYDLGAIIEGKKGSLFFFVQFLILAALSNSGQFMMSGPSFGGMSGVVY